MSLRDLKACREVFRTISRRMLPDTAHILQQELAEFTERMYKLARQDRLISPIEALTNWKFTAAFGSVDFSAILGRIDSDERIQ